MKQGQFPAILPLASLNGQNGFKLDGENYLDESGYSVSAAGDINGDGHADLVIGAYQCVGIVICSGPGRSYVVFGGQGVGSQGLLSLSSLNGTNGFKLEGEVIGDYSGISVSAAGDINGDGYADLLIGAVHHASAMGRSYVVFGGPEVGQQGLIPLSSLNGTNGFKLDGEMTGDISGISVSAVSSINGEGYVDLLIGASGHASQMGRSYVVFGGSEVGRQGLILLSSLNGTNGFKLDGEASGDGSGRSVSAAGDINGDGYADLLIGAYGHSPAGRSYVVFGGPGVGRQGLISLSSLNGTNGFKLDGETTGDASGEPVSVAGDINGDGYADLLIGVSNHVPAGRSYVVFGGPGVGRQGLILLSSLNGTNGFKLDGEASDGSGCSVSAAGDINGDGYIDLLIGADGHANATGRSYVVFGGAGVGRQGLIPLSLLNGANGFKLDGELTGDCSGSSVSAVGDVNGDGVADIVIGAYLHNNRTGRSYVVFGDIPPTLMQNRLILHSGSKVSLNSTFLSAYDRNHKNNTLLFFPTNVTHGHFESVKQPGVPLINFTQPQLLNGTIRFVHDGSSLAPSYNITVCSPGIAWTGPSAANITFTPGPTTTPVSSTTTSPGASSSTLIPSVSPSPVVTLTPASTIKSPATITSGSVSTPTPFSPTTPTPTSTPTMTPTSNFTPPVSFTPSSNDNSILPILIGAVVGGLAAFAALCGGAWYYRRKKQAALKTLTKETTDDGKLLFPVQSVVLTSSGVSPATVELVPVSQRQSPFPPPPSISEHRSEKSAVESLSELKISSRSHSSHMGSQLIDEVGDMKISLGVSYQDLEFDEKDKLGSGAFGTVYKGSYKFNQVAIKQLHTQHLSQEALDELKLEAGILGSMRSDYIVQLRGICLEAPNYCLVMELMPKGSLYSVLQNSPELPLSVRYQIGLDVCYGLYHLHEKNILHRDLKSLNVLLDGQFRAKITDFGLSKIKSEMSSASSTQGMKGTLGWMAPELFEEKPQATAAADIYAFGMVLWEMMMNPYRIPFQGLAFTSVLTAKVKRGEKQETISESCPPELAQVIRVCWQEPDKRPSAKVLAKSLSTIFKSSQEQPAKTFVQSLQKDEVVQKDDLLTAAF